MNNNTDRDKLVAWCLMSCDTDLVTARQVIDELLQKGADYNTIKNFYRKEAVQTLINIKRINDIPKIEQVKTNKLYTKMDHELNDIKKVAHGLDELARIFGVK